MGTSRPFFNDTIEKLENDFLDRQVDAEFLQLLAAELKFRSTTRAKNLELKVIDTLKKIQAGTSAKNNHTQFSGIKLNEKKQAPLILNKGTDILSAWTALEVLSPQAFRRPEELAFGGDRKLIAPLNNGTMPWGEKAKPNTRLYFHIIIGTIDMEKATSVLMQQFADTRAERPAARGETILATVVVNANGCLAEQPSIAISSFAWGIQHAMAGNFLKLADWSKAERELQQELQDLLTSKDRHGEIMPLSSTSITLAHNKLVERLNLPNEILTNNRFAIRVYEYHTNPDPPEPLLLNSFYLGDLIKAKDIIATDQAPRNLRLFLGIDQPAKRTDILANEDALETAVAPENFPPVRWPAARGSLVLLQQAAVNLGIKELTQNGVFAVNGPPGTGKTTLLRDTIAAIITRRAEAMCQFSDPATAFTHTNKKIKAGQGWLHLYTLSEDLKGFEILIASSNNKAVENITAELPGIHTISNDIGLRYFKSLSDELLGRETWGIIAAVLGNAQNRSKFRQAFWWSADFGLSTYLAQAAGTPQFIDVKDPSTGEVIERRPPKIITSENCPAGNAEALQRWNVAKENFKTATEKSRSGLAALKKTRENIKALPALATTHADAKNHLDNAIKVDTTGREELQYLLNQHSTDTAHLAKQKELLNDHRKLRPGFFALLFRTSRARVWSQRNKELHTAHKQAARKAGESSNAVEQAERIAHRNKETVLSMELKHQEAAAAYAKLHALVQETKERFGGHLIDNEFSSLPYHQRQQFEPWCDHAMQQLRNNVFIAAMNLHKAFIDAAAKPLRHNIGALMQAFAGYGLSDEEKIKLLPDLWASLFLIVPTISTTFASVERMLGSLPAGSLGWLLIDEAGQALPQAAVGAIMRTKRAMIVGDPIQIEPIVVLPEALTQNICKYFNIDPDKYNAPEASVQTLADSASPFYTEIHGKYGSRTVGLPLLVHRRCAEPMFGISNAVAYEYLMVQAKAPAKSVILDCLGPSRWINVRGNALDKWSPEEGDMVLKLLMQLNRSSINPDLFIITPFVVVAENLRRLIVESKVLDKWTADPWKWAMERIGTVHTVQGREAEAVIFVLGAPEVHQSGARNWAGSKPNLLNVAVTRAKEALYVIGNRDLWAVAGLFKELSGRLE